MKSPKHIEFSKIVGAYLNGTATPEQVVLVENYFELFSTVPNTLNDTDPIYEASIHDRMKMNIDRRIKSNEKSTFLLYKRVAYIAAAILLVTSTGVLLYNVKQTQIASKLKDTQNIAQITPGSNKAILILANGEKVTLTGKGKGKIAEQKETSIHQEKSGQLIYKSLSKSSTGKLEYNTIEIPKGGQYQLILPDGTKVWMNAASTLHYPLAFLNNERIVELNGEAYFEVAKVKSKPFKVLTKHQEVKVLGTHFNINAYSDETNTKTSLQEGSVQVQSLDSKDVMIIKPGEQSVLQENNEFKKLKIDLDEVAAWKNGYFMFEDETLENILKQLSRWYNVEIEYKDNKLKNQLFSGTLSKYSNASQVLKKLELTESVHFIIDGRRIIVMQ